MRGAEGRWESKIRAYFRLKNDTHLPQHEVNAERPLTDISSVSLNARSLMPWAQCFEAQSSMNRKVLYEPNFRQRSIIFSGTVLLNFSHQVGAFFGPTDRISGFSSPFYRSQAHKWNDASCVIFLTIKQPSFFATYLLWKRSSFWDSAGLLACLPACQSASATLSTSSLLLCPAPQLSEAAWLAGEVRQGGQYNFELLAASTMCCGVRIMLQNPFWAKTGARAWKTHESRLIQRDHRAISCIACGFPPPHKPLLNRKTNSWKLGNVTLFRRGFFCHLIGMASQPRWIKALKGEFSRGLICLMRLIRRYLTKIKKYLCWVRTTGPPFWCSRTP